MLAFYPKYYLPFKTVKIRVLWIWYFLNRSRNKYSNYFPVLKMWAFYPTN